MIHGVLIDKEKLQSEIETLHTIAQRYNMLIGNSGDIHTVIRHLWDLVKDAPPAAIPVVAAHDWTQCPVEYEQDSESGSIPMCGDNVYSCRRCISTGECPQILKGESR